MRREARPSISELANNANGDITITKMSNSPRHEDGRFLVQLCPIQRHLYDHSPQQSVRAL